MKTLVDEVGEKYLELVRTVGLASSIAQAAADDLQISYEEQMDMFGTTEFYASAFASLTVPENEVLIRAPSEHGMTELSMQFRKLKS